MFMLLERASLLFTIFVTASSITNAPLISDYLTLNESWYSQPKNRINGMLNGSLYWREGLLSKEGD